MASSLKPDLSTDQRVTLDDVNAFVSVAAHGSFARAARHLDWDASAVSRRITRLERLLGVRLVARTTRRMSLTEAGRLYLQRVEPLLDELQDAGRAVSSLSTEPRGELRLTVSASFGRRWVAGMIAPFLTRYPDVRIELQLSNRVVDLLEDGFDLAIRTGDLRESSLVVRTIASYRHILVASPGYVRRHGTPQSLQDLSTHACLGFRHADGSTEWRFGRSDDRSPTRPRWAVVSDSSEALVEAAKGGAGIFRGPEWLVSDALSNGLMVEILPDIARSAWTGIHAVMPPGRMIPAKTRAFVDELQRSLLASAPPFHAAVPGRA